MNILITGAGLIGSNAARQAVDNGHKVALFDLSPNRDYIDKIVGRDKAGIVAADIRDLPALLSALEKFNIDTIVHTAGLIGSRVQENSYTGATNNILGTINILEAARLRKLRRVVYVSTFGVYDRSKINHSVIHETDPIGGHNLYATTKVCSEHLVHAYASMYNLDTVIIRPGGVFGRGFYVGGSTVGKVMRDLALAIIKDEPINIDAKTYGPNEYVYGKDVGMALFLACQAKKPKTANLQRRHRRCPRPGRACSGGQRTAAQRRESKSAAQAAPKRAAAFRWTSACRRRSWTTRRSSC